MAKLTHDNMTCVKFRLFLWTHGLPLRRFLWWLHLVKPYFDVGNLAHVSWYPYYYKRGYTITVLGEGMSVKIKITTSIPLYSTFTYSVSVLVTCWQKLLRCFFSQLKSQLYSYFRTKIRYSVRRNIKFFDISKIF